MGVIPEWDNFTDSQKQEYASQSTPQHAGVEPSLELLEWLWDSGISAVAGDAISWEVFPTQGEISCHEYLLGGWGMPIGKLLVLLLSLIVRLFRLFGSLPLFIYVHSSSFSPHSRISHLLKSSLNFNNRS